MNLFHAPVLGRREIITYGLTKLLALHYLCVEG